MSEHLRSRFATFPAFGANGRVAASGGKTLDDFRWIRASWEVEASSNGWVGYAKGGAYSPFYADVYLLIDWRQNARALKEYLVTYRSSRGWSPNWTAELHGSDHYLRQGLTWSRRTKSELSVRALPANCVFGDKGPAAFVDNNDAGELLCLLAIASSKPFRALVEFQLAAAEPTGRGGVARSYEVGVIQRTPVPNLSNSQKVSLARLARRAWSLKRSLDTTNETSHAFLLPRGVTGVDRDVIEGELKSIQKQIEVESFALYGVLPEDCAAIEASPHVDAASGDIPDGLGEDEDDESNKDDTLDSAPQSQQSCRLGREPSQRPQGGENAQ